MNNTPDNNSRNDIRGLYDFVTEVGRQTKNPYPLSFQDFSRVMQKEANRRGLYDKLSKRAGIGGTYEDFERAFFNPYSQGTQVAALRNKTFTRDPAKEMARQQALSDASRGQYNPFGTSEVSYRPEVRGLGTNIAPIDLVEGEDTMPEPKTPAGDLPKTTRTFGGGVVSGTRGIIGGAQIAVAELLKMFGGGDSDDEKEAIHLINQMERDGTLSLDTIQEMRKKLGTRIATYTPAGFIYTPPSGKISRQLDALKLIEERMQRMGQDLTPERREVALDAMRSDLSEKGASEDKENPFVRWKEGAKDYMRKSEVPEGTWAELGSATASVGGALAGQAISMIPGAAPVGQAISWASIGAQTVSSGGQAIMDMEDYAAEKGVYISPEDKATISLGYMAAEFGGDALGGAVASKSISAIGKLAGGRIGQKLAVRSLAKGIAGNEGVRQSLSSLSEYARKPLAIPLAKSAGRQIVRGAVTEGPGESLTTLAQSGALDRVWKSKEDQEAWSDVARQAVKDGIYGAWAGALMGGFGAGIQSGQVAHMHRKEGLTLVQDEKNNLYEVIGSDQSSYLVLDRAGRQKMLPADQVVDAIHYTPQERKESQKAYDEATEGLHPKEEVLTENQKRAGAILSATEQQQSPIYRATHPEVAEEELNSPVALAGAKKALADVLEGQNEEVRARIDQMALVLKDGEADPTEELTKLFSDESLSDNDRQSILDVETAQSRLATIERSHQEAKAQMQNELTKEWSAKSVVGDETARGAVISATITDADGKQKQVYVTGGVRVVTNEDGTVELLPTDDDAPIYVYDESVEGDEKGHIVQMDDLSSPQLVAEDYLDLVQASLDEAETAFRSEVQAAEEQGAKRPQMAEEIEFPNGTRGTALKGESALTELDRILEERSSSATALPTPIESAEAFEREFADPVQTPISSVRVTQGAFEKIVGKGRLRVSGAIRPTLENPDLIIKDGDAYLYVKVYRSADGTVSHNIVSVEKSIDGENILVSIHPKTDSNLRNKIKSGGLLTLQTSANAEQGEQPQGLQSELPTDLYGKGTEKSEGEQFLSSLPRTREGEVDGLKLMSERPDDFIRYLGQLYGDDFVASLPLSKSGALNLKALTPEQTLKVNEAALGKSGAVEAARQRRSKVGAERSKLEAEVKSDLGNLEKRMALRKASEEYRLYDGYVRTAEEQARQELEAKKRAEEAALTSEERQRREEEKRQLAQEKKEREERIRLENERRRREREELERNAEGSTVREYTEDPPRQARARGARLVNGAVVYRQEPMTVEHYADAERAFSQRPGETRVPVKRTIVEAESLQASHKEGQMNPRHFIPEAQPKDRADNGLSSTAADRIASDIRPDEITGGITAYTGAPVVNGRGEVIQGNNRTDALQTMYDGEERHAKSAELYKEYLKAHASEYGMTAEQVDAMAHPVAVDVAEVSDSEAIRLGHRGQTDLESAGADTMNAQTVGEELNSDTDPQSGQSMLVSFFNRIFNRTGANGAELSAKMDNMLNRNAEEGLQFLHENGYLTDTQYKNAFETNSEGKRVVTAEAKTALKDVALYQLADVIGPRAMDIFYRLPASARNGLATFLYRDSQASFETSLAPDLGDALLVWDSLRQDPDFAGQTNFESAKIFILGKVSLFGRSELETNLGEASSLAKLLAASMQTQTEEQIAGALNQYYDLVGANETGAKTQSLMPTSQPTDTKAGAAEAVYGRVYEVPSGREKHYRFRRDVAEDFRARRDALADRITEERRKRAAAMDMSRTFGVPMKLHEDMSTLPEEVRAGFDETHFVKGWFYKGDNAIHIYFPANVDADDVRATFLHEAVGHYGCRELLGEVGYNQVLDGIANKLGEEEVLRAMNEYCNGSQDLTNRGQVRIAMDEWIAHRAESGITKNTVWESIKDFFRNVFGLSGKQIDQSAEMMADDLLRRSAKNLQKRAERQQTTAPEVSPERAEVRFRSNRSASDFARLRDAAIEQKGLVAPGLNQSSVKVTHVMRHDFTGTGLQAIEKAMEWAQGRIVKDHWYHKGMSDGFKYLIDGTSVEKYLSESSTTGSDNLGVHLATLKVLPRVINRSILAETHPDYGKVNGRRSAENGVNNPNLLVHRLYGAIEIDGQLYRVKTTLHERYNADDRAYDYMVTNMELVISGSSTSNALTSSTNKHTSTERLAVAKLLKGVEKSYESGKLLLDESENTGSEEETTRFRRAERAGDVSGAAEAVSDFMRNATPKNTSVDDVLRFLRVYHNSPHLLKKADGSFVDPDTGERLGFDHRFIGSGEGFQAHGWGSYFSVNDLAHYASTNDGDTYDGIKITKNDKYVISKGGDTNTSLILFQAIRMGYRTNTAPQAEDTIAKFVEEKLSELSESQERRLAKQKRLLDALKGNEPWAMTAINSRWGEVITDPKTGYEYDTTYSLEEFEQETYERIKEEAKKYRDALEFIERNPDYVKNFTSKAVRHKYQVEIPNPQTHRYLEEGALLTKEEESRIREAAPDTKRIKYHRLNEERLEGRKVWEVYDLLSKVLNGADKASALLNKAGFVGIHYNGRIDGECYVIFNEKDAQITDHIRFRREEREKIRKDAMADGTWMKAPNGEKSNLSERDWVTVRTKAFKDWFGDWETYDDGLLDENYEPRVFYHRSPKVFTEFSRDAIGSKTDPGFLGRGFYFFSDPQEGDGYGNNTYPVFLKMKYPYYAENEDVSMLAEAYSSKASSDFTERLKSEGYDGVIYTGDLREELMVFDPEQIKSAIGNTGTFDGANPDIRYRKAHLAGVHTLTTDNLRHALKMGGLANPSIAVYDTERGLPTRTFGEVALIAPRDLVDAKTGRHKGTYNRDSWSPVYPRIAYDLTEKGHDLMRELDKKRGEREGSLYALHDLVMEEPKILDKDYFIKLLSVDQQIKELYRSEAPSIPFDQYVEKIAEPILKERQEMLYAGQNPDGSKRYVPHTLENVSKVMSEDFSKIAPWDLFMESLVDLSEKYKSLESIRRNEDRMAGMDDSLYKKVEKEFHNLAEELVSDKPETMYPAEPAKKLQALIVNNDNRYGRPLTVTEEARVSALREQMKALPTDYFETKVDRPVGLSEFVEAVVPEGTSPELVAELEKSGLKVSTYDSTKDGAMNEAVLSAMDRSDATDRGVRFRAGERNIEEVNRTFNEELEKYVSSSNHTTLQAPLTLGMPSSVLLSCGLPLNEITLPLGVIKKALVKHHLKLADLRNLPKALIDPLLVYEWGTKARSMIIVTDLNVGDNKLTVAIKIERGGRILEINEIASIHDKVAGRFLEDMTTATGGGLSEALRYVRDKKKALDWLGIAPPRGASAQANPKLSDIANVINGFENPKIEKATHTDPKLRFRRAERAGDVGGAAEAVSDFMRNATPKNTTVDDVLRFLRVYHNSPHLLKKADGSFVEPETGERLGFDHRFMGSGEGAQAHGWGSYFSVKDLADYASTYDPSVYHGMRITQNDEYVISNGGNAKTSELLFETVYGLCKSCETAPDEDAIKRYVIETITSRFQEHQQEANRQRRLLDALKDNEPWAVTVTNAQAGDIITDPKTRYRYSEEDSSVDYVRWRYEISKKMEGRYGKVLSFTKSNPDYVEHFVAKVERHKYAVEIPDPDTNHYIREDRRLTKHEEEMIRKAINDKWELRDSVLAKRSWRGITGKEAYEDLSLALGAKQASLLFNEAGFVGIHYNGRQDGECYVIFNENDAKITDHYRFRRTERTDPKSMSDPINPQWDGEWYSPEDLTGKSTADLLDLPAAPETPEKQPTQSVAEYAETMSRHYADPRVRFRTGSHTESLRAPQPPRITDGMSLYEVAQLQHEYNRNYRDYLSSSMKRMDALVTTKGRFIRYMVDSARPVELFCKEMERMGIGMTPEQNIYQDMMTQSSRELNMRKQEVEPLVTKLTDRIRDLREQKLLDKVMDVSYTFTDEDTNETKTIKRADGYDKVSLYFQAKDIVECEQLGLVSRGREGFEDVVTEFGKPSNHITPEAYIASFEASVGKANAEALCDDMRKMSRWSIDRLHGAGLMTDDQYRSLTQSPRRYYAPQRGFKITEESDRNAYERVEMTAEGRQSLSGDPIAYMQAIMNTTVMRVVRNQDLLHLYEWVTQHQKELARRGVLEIGETYYRKAGVDKKGNPIYMPSKQAPTIEELRHDADARRQIAKLRMDQKRLDQSNAKGETADYVYKVKSKEISYKISDLNNSIEILYRDPTPLRGDEKEQDEALRRTVKVYKDGVEQQIHFSPQYRGELVADVLNGRPSMDQDTRFYRSVGRYIEKAGAINFVSKATRFMSALMTQYNPNFAVTNALRDYGTALISNVSDFGWAYQRDFMANYAKVQKTVLKYTMSDAYSDGTYPQGKYGAYLKEFFDEGAATGWSFLPDVVKIRQTMKEMSDPSLKQKFINGKYGVANAFGLKQGIGMITEASELNTRFAEYVTSRERGYSKKEAAKHAKELTVNFNRKGTLAGVFGSFFGFWNASIQGTNKIVRLGRHGAEWCGTLFAGGLAQGLLYALGAPDKDDERAFTEWEMMTNLCMGDVKIPLPQGFRGFWGAGVQMALAIAGKKDWQSGLIDGMQYLVGELLPNEAAALSNIVEWDDVTGNVKLNSKKVLRDVVPTAIQPEMDVILNMDFMGNPVYREPFIKSQEGQIAQRTLGKKRTKKVYKDLSDKIWYAMGGSLERNDLMSRDETHILPDDVWLNPSVIEHVFEGRTTGVGKTLADIATCVSAASNGDPSELRKLQIVNVLTKQEKDYSDSDRSYWKLMDFYRSRQQTMSNLRKAKEGEDFERYREMTKRVSELAPRMTGEQLTEKIWDDGTKDEKLYVTWLETKVLLKQIDKGTVTKEEVAPTIDRLTEQFRELR